ncbi:hypothetical protein QBC34DRAFT_385240 [Podospora aff. communis PSN243]|uniref:Uncharacterized protein n=1 Tax=Podospora aff. communis PSN243 TaxID=3040156 RepID=A0AAV9GBB7_9PEZI|nr:hypothetical protein QBC34DRAFT_385240 [Podospora aff. communis PSN243]
MAKMVTPNGIHAHRDPGVYLDDRVDPAKTMQPAAAANAYGQIRRPTERHGYHKRPPRRYDAIERGYKTMAIAFIHYFDHPTPSSGPNSYTWAPSNRPAPPPRAFSLDSPAANVIPGSLPRTLCCNSRCSRPRIPEGYGFCRDCKELHCPICRRAPRDPEYNGLCADCWYSRATILSGPERAKWEAGWYQKVGVIGTTRSGEKAYAPRPAEEESPVVMKGDVDARGGREENNGTSRIGGRARACFSRLLPVPVRTLSSGTAGMRTAFTFTPKREWEELRVVTGPWSSRTKPQEQSWQEVRKLRERSPMVVSSEMMGNVTMEFLAWLAEHWSTDNPQYPILYRRKKALEGVVPGRF